MIDKKILLLTGAGIAAISIAIAITVNIVVNKPDSPGNTSDHLTCAQFKAAVERQTAAGRATIEQLPALLRSNLDWISATDPTCHIEGDNWILDKGIITVQSSDEVDIHDGINLLTTPL